MKSLFYVSVIVCFFLTSCEREVELLEDEVEYTKSIEPVNSKAINESVVVLNYKGLTPPTESEIFINKMEWASYIAAKIIYNSSDSEKAEIEGLVVNQKIPLEDLIGPNTQLQSFHDLFVEYLFNYLKSVGCPGDDENTPNKIMIEDPKKTTNQLVTEYLDYMLNQNCVELYFPVGILDGDKDVISLSHPLTEYYGNYGYQRQEGCVSTFIAYIVPNHVYINRFNYTYIIARPIRKTTPEACLYPQYAGIDFTQFLEGPF